MSFDFNPDRVVVACGVPQGSNVGSLLFKLWMPPLIIQKRKHRFDLKSSFSVSLSSVVADPRNTLTQCINCIHVWISHNFLQLSKDKRETLFDLKMQI